MLSDDDRIPWRVLRYVIIDQGRCESSGIENGEKLPRKAHDNALVGLIELGDGSHVLIQYVARVEHEHRRVWFGLRWQSLGLVPSGRVSNVLASASNWPR